MGILSQCRHQGAWVRSLTIDRARHARLVRDLMLQWISSPPGMRRLGGWTALAVVVGWVFNWPLGVGVAAAAVLMQLTMWHFRVARALRHGLGVGQSITLGYADSGELALEDVTGPLLLPHGSVNAVVRRRGIATVRHREVTFVLPVELLTDADIAFLEGHGDVPERPSVLGPTLPLSLQVTSAVQSRLLADATRSLVTSAAFLISFLPAPILLGAAALLDKWLLIVVAVYFVGMALLWLRWIRWSRSNIRRAYPVGRTIRGLATAEELMLSTPHRTQRAPWSDYQAHRLTPDTLLLRGRRHPRFTYAFPRALFPQAALTTMTQAVPRRF